jgi:hypothetical protein
VNCPNLFAQEAELVVIHSSFACTFSRASLPTSTAAWLEDPNSPPRLLDPVTRGDVELAALHHLPREATAVADAGLLLRLMDAQEWIKPRHEDFAQPSSGYVVSFITFHECGFFVPVGRFIRAVLLAYGVELHYLNPNGIQHLVEFEVLCKGFLKVEPH